ncbi:MAG TPA: oxidoreductase [Rickettsiales bacterium]|nr:oxidoreductase [Rickettsiales bacterium]
MSQSTQTWFITGTSSGFGHAFAEYALAQGHNVVATARNTASLDKLVQKASERVLAVKLDVTKPQDANAAVKAAIAKFGRIDVLINNAGYAIVGAVEETPDNELRALMDTNFFGAMNVIRAALPTLRAQKSGAIVNISSMGGQMSYAGYGAYSASKFALEGASEALALELAPFGIKVMIVEPGAFRTELVGKALHEMPALDAYEETVGQTRAFTRQMHRTQEGDPRKAAEAIAQAIASDNTPLRLQLGSDSVEAVRNHSEKLLSDLKQWEKIASATAFTTQAA